MNKFNEIFLDLEQKILAKEYPPHSLLPSENQLIKNKEKVRSYWIGIASTFLFLD